jgi:hypothetical protein
MDALIIILGIILAYVAFVTITIALARIMFPKIEIKDSELIGEGLVKLTDKMKRIRSNIRTTSYQKKYSAINE